jgi:predicted 2-oxoglutarate/Fe(II)-dependent dioxygenase YbiX
MKELKDYIMVVHDVLTHEQCDKLVHNYKNSEWAESTVGNVTGEISVDKTSRNCYDTAICQPLSHQLMCNQADKIIKLYRDNVSDALSTIGNEGFWMLRYDEGGYFHQHVDHGHTNRRLSVSWALNDDYEGGEWGFFDNEVKFTVPKGGVLMFPSNFIYTHQVNEITKGTRYSIVTWLV